MAMLTKTAISKKKKRSWVIPVILLLVIGFPFMAYSFSPLPILPEDVQLADAPAITLEGQSEPTMTVDAAELVQLLARSPRARRPENPKKGENERMRITFTLAATETGEPQACEIRLYDGAMPETLEGFFRNEKFSYPLQDATSLARSLAAAMQPLAE